MLYHFFGLLWTNQFIQGIAILVISGSFSKWYFAGPHDGEEEDKPDDYEERMTTPVLKSCYRTVRYHMGTAMFGSFIIAVVQFARAMLAYLEENTKTWQEGNRVSRSKRKKGLKPYYFFNFYLILLNASSILHASISRLLSVHLKCSVVVCYVLKNVSNMFLKWHILQLQYLVQTFVYPHTDRFNYFVENQL